MSDSVGAILSGAGTANYESTSAELQQSSDGARESMTRLPERSEADPPVEHDGNSVAVSANTARASGSALSSASSSSSSSLGSTNSLVDEDDPSTRLVPRLLHFLRHFLRCFCFPLIVLLSTIGFLLFLLFFCFPLFLFFLFLICVYYCCTDEPIPPRVLFRALWEDNADPLGGGSAALQSTTPYPLHRILSGIVSRTVLDVANMDPERDGAAVDVRDKPLHDGPVYLLVDAESSVRLYLSAPIPAKQVDDDADEENSIDTANAVHEPRTPPTRILTRALTGDGSDRETGELADSSNELELDEEQGHASAGGSSSVEMTDSRPVGVAAALGTAPAALNDLTLSSSLNCDICLCEYAKGDTLSWSRNPRCLHTFHLDCIVDWLRRRPTCPSCRQDFVILTSSENVSP